ncbi:RCCD1 family protein [Megaselia abdita]
MNYFTGFNGFHQFGTTHARRVLTPAAVNLKDILENNDSCINGTITQVAASWSYVVLVIGDVELVFSGFITKKPDTVRKIKVSWKIKQIAVGENCTIVLLENGDLIKVNIHTMTSEKMSFLNTENRSKKRNIFGEIQTNGFSGEEDSVEHISCGSIFSVAVTKNNYVYNIPTKIFEFSKDESRIVSLVSGFEHALALNSNGDVYSWGEGLRGQLGDETMKMRRVPSLVEPLAGIKIVSISAGGWHSAAVSSFGDVYLWGFNSHGQLGIKLYKDGIPDADPQKNPSVYPVPQLVEVTCSCIKENKVTEDKPVDTETESTSTRTESSKSSSEDSSSTESNIPVSESNLPVSDSNVPTLETSESNQPTESTDKKDEPKDVEMPLVNNETEKENQNEHDKENKSNDDVEMHLESSCNVVKAFCGSRHTIIQMECGKFFAVGSNENGQLGLGLKDNLCDQFQEITAISNKKVFCGPWSTIFQDIK